MGSVVPRRHAGGLPSLICSELVPSPDVQAAPSVSGLADAAQRCACRADERRTASARAQRRPRRNRSAGKAQAAKPAAAGATTTRVELEKIDRVVNMVGELVIAQAMLGQVVHTLPEDVSGRLAQVLEEVVHHTRELKDSVMSMRAQQVNAVFQRMPRLVRELADEDVQEGAARNGWAKTPRSIDRSSNVSAIR